MYLANLHGRERFVRRVAVKVMREGLDAAPDLVARQKDEARLLGLLAHEGIVQVLDLTEVNGRPAVVMEYVEGVDLAEVRKATGTPLPVRAALEAVAGVASALDAAYNSVSALTDQPLRVIHRDIKPANVLLTATGRVKVLDFGVAKGDFARDGHTTAHGFGTPRFMAPEMWLGDPCGAPIDAYALGVSLYDLVADAPWARPPLARTAFEAHVARLLDGVAGVPEPVLALIASMTAFDPGDRPTAAEIREHGEALVQDAPGDSLARYARAVVPGLVEAKSQRTANEPVPGPVGLGGASRSPDPVRMGPEPSLAAARAPSTAPAPAAAPRPWLLAAGGATVLGIGLVAVAFALVAWRLMPDATPSAGPTDPVVTATAADPAGAASTALATTEDALAAARATGDPASLPAAGATPALGADPAGADPSVSLPTGSTSRARASTPAEAGARGTRATPPTSSAPATAPTSGATTNPSGTSPATAPGTPGMAAPSGAASATTAAPAALPVTLTSVPTSAEVWVDGKRVGETPLRGLALPAGAHTVELVLEGRRSAPRTFSPSPTTAVNLRYDFASDTWRSVK